MLKENVHLKSTTVPFHKCKEAGKKVSDLRKIKKTSPTCFHQVTASQCLLLARCKHLFFLMGNIFQRPFVAY